MSQGGLSVAGFTGDEEHAAVPGDRGCQPCVELGQLLVARNHSRFIVVVRLARPQRRGQRNQIGCRKRCGDELTARHAQEAIAYVQRDGEPVGQQFGHLKGGSPLVSLDFLDGAGRTIDLPRQGRTRQIQILPAMLDPRTE